MYGVRADKQYCSRSCQTKAAYARKQQGVDLKTKICLKCGSNFELKDNGYGRVYCYNCVPNAPRSGAEMRKIIKSWVVEELGGKCQICNYDKCQDALDLHHKNPSEKEFSISDRNLRYTDWPLIKQEIKKCILVCSNCHREIHAGLYPEYLEGGDE